MAKIYIDDRAYNVAEGKNLLETCLSLGLNLPYFCWHPELGSVGACRQCAVKSYKDENDERGRLVMACQTAVKDGMRFSLKDEWADQFRKGNIEALMINHPHDCAVCDEGGECHLQDMTFMTGHNYRRYDFNKRTHVNQDLGPFINHEMNRCIQCYRCVRFYNDYADGQDFNVFAAHDSVYFGRSKEGTLESEFSGNLVEVCPTGVFTDKTLKKHYTRKWDLTSTPSICHGCSLGCNILVSERYGTVRRILDRYNGDVNRYFICDRGRFGYEYINDEEARIVYALKREEGGGQVEIDKESALLETKALLQKSEKIIGIGSPRASLESNYMLQRLVGKENFYAGIEKGEGKLVNKIKNILNSGRVKTPSMAEAEKHDVVFVIGEDLTNTAPRLALALRQAAKVRPSKKAHAMGIPEWDDATVREVVQHEKGPFYVATTHKTKLNNIATESYYATPDDIARLVYAVAHEIDNNLPAVEGLDQTVAEMAKHIAADLKTAENPLIVSGASLCSEVVVESAADLAYTVKDQNENTGLIYVVPEVNSMGLAMLTDHYLDDACSQESDLVITMENDLYRRIDGTRVDELFEKTKHTIALESMRNNTTQSQDLVLPAGTFAESTGTVVNNEGRAQRFYQVYKPDEDMQSSWAWFKEIMELGEAYHFDQVVEDMVAAYPELQLVEETAPKADARFGTQKIPRATHRFSGRTSMRAHRDIDEPKPPEDPDSAMSFTMEGMHGRKPSPLTSYYWAPGWNSVQSINKQQIDVGGDLHDGNPGKRLFEPQEGSDIPRFNRIPEAFQPKKGACLALPIHYIYGSEELTAKSPAIMKRIPETAFTMNPEDAAEGGIEEGEEISINFNEHILKLPVKFDQTLAQGILGIPKGFEETESCVFPFWVNVKKV